MFFYASGNLEKRGTDGNPPMTPAGKAALLEWIAGGGGFVAVHAGSDCFQPGAVDTLWSDQYRFWGRRVSIATVPITGQKPTERRFGKVAFLEA